MLLWLFSWLEAFDPGFAVFPYLTLRTILSVLRLSAFPCSWGR